MNIKLIVLAVALVGCSVSKEEKLAQLADQRAQVFADLHRQQAECQAQAIEFAGDRNIVESCVAALQVMAEASANVVASIDKRSAEIGRTGK